jgi:hypothetical protein
MKARAVIALAVGTLALIAAVPALASPPAQVFPTPGATFTSGDPFVFQASPAGAATPSQIDFYVSDTQDRDGGVAVLSPPWIDHLRGNPLVGNPTIFQAVPRADAAWPKKPGTYFWQAVYTNCSENPPTEPPCYSELRSFTVNPLPASAVTNPAQIETFWKRHPSHRVRRRKAKFGFRSNVAGATFRCLFAQGWANCTSPHVFRNLRPGRYTFKVRAVVNGLEDPTPLSWTFRVLRPRPPQNAQSQRRR